MTLNRHLEEFPPLLMYHGGSFHLETRRVAPKVLQIVESAFVSMKHVDHYPQVIEHDPLTGREPVDRYGSNRVILSQSRFNFVRDGFDLRLRCGRTNHEEIGERRDCAQIEDYNIFRLLVGSEFGAGFR
jgi:hypothetical protein